MAFPVVCVYGSFFLFSHPHESPSVGLPVTCGPTCDLLSVFGAWNRRALLEVCTFRWRVCISTPLASSFSSSFSSSSSFLRRAGWGQAREERHEQQLLGVCVWWWWWGGGGGGWGLGMSRGLGGNFHFSAVCFVCVFCCCWFFGHRVCARAPFCVCVCVAFASHVALTNNSWKKLRES